MVNYVDNQRCNTNSNNISSLSRNPWIPKDRQKASMVTALDMYTSANIRLLVDISCNK